jgi:DNA mismatch repair protein MSH3
MISSFFSQPSQGAGAGSEPLSGSSSPIDLTISDDDDQPAKRRKTTHGPTPDSNTQRRHQSPRPPASRWRYVPSQSPEKTAVDAEFKKRRELFAKQLLADNSSFVDTAGPSDGHVLPSDQADGGPNSSDVQSDGEFKHLQELFARKTEQKKKRKAVQERSSKKQPELGPSGEPYTALELQVRSFLADWRTDVHNE